jgi:hypothetical protein
MSPIAQMEKVFSLRTEIPVKLVLAKAGNGIQETWDAAAYWIPA